MIPATIKNATHVLAAPKNWDPKLDGECAPLAVRIPRYGSGHVVQSAWLPSEVDLAKLNAGEPIILTIFGGGMPPVSLQVGDEHVVNEDPSITYDAELPKDGT